MILKADYKGSIEVLKKALEELSTVEIKVKILHCRLVVFQNQMCFADASDAIVIGFYVTPEDKARMHWRKTRAWTSDFTKLSTMRRTK